MLETRKLANSSHRYVPFTINLSKVDGAGGSQSVLGPSEDTSLSFNRYLSVVQNQMEFINGLRASLTRFTPSPPPPPPPVFAQPSYLFWARCVCLLGDSAEHIQKSCIYMGKQWPKNMWVAWRSIAFHVLFVLVSQIAEGFTPVTTTSAGNSC